MVVHATYQLVSFEIMIQSWPKCYGTLDMLIVIFPPWFVFVFVFMFTFMFMLAVSVRPRRDPKIATCVKFITVGGLRLRWPGFLQSHFSFVMAWH